MVSVTFDETALVCMAKLAEVAAAGTSTLTGTTHESLGSSRTRVTTAPSDGADAVKWTVPIRGFPPTILVALKLMEDKETSVLLLLCARSCAWSSAVLLRTSSTRGINFFIGLFLLPFIEFPSPIEWRTISFGSGDRDEAPSNSIHLHQRKKLNRNQLNRKPKPFASSHGR